MTSHSKDVLWLDYETYSKVPIKQQGADVYSRDPSTKALMLGWAINDEAPLLWDIEAGEPLPARLEPFFLGNKGTFRAFNAPFEIAITEQVLSRILFNPIIDLNQWQCSQVLAYGLSFVGPLGAINGQFELPSDSQKDAEGKKLIQFFCCPTPGKKGGLQRLPCDHPVKWERFKSYCLQDIVAMRDLWRKCELYNPMSDDEWTNWRIDREINTRGIPVDSHLVDIVVESLGSEKIRLTEELKKLTGLSSVTPVPLRRWLEFYDCSIPNMQKATKEKALKTATGKVKEALELSLLIAQTSSASKWNAFDRRTDKEAGVLRETLQFAGASRTRRWAGRGVQLQNLKRTVKETDANIDYILSGAPATMTQITTSIRGAIAAPPGKVLVVSDLSSIESRLAGWVTGCTRIMNTFASGRDTYKDLATEIFKVNYSQVTKEQRTFAKPAALGCFAADTLVLTNCGWVPIVDIDDFHTIWDGEKWVNHKGVIAQGQKPVIDMYGVKATPGHRILSGSGQWVSWKDLADGNILKETLQAGGSCSNSTEYTGCASVNVGALNGCRPGTSTPGNLPNAENATTERRENVKLPNLWQKSSEFFSHNLIGWLTDTMRSPADARISQIRTTGEEASGAHSGHPWTQFAISNPSQGGATLSWRSIESTMTRITRRATFALCPTRLTLGTRELIRYWSTKACDIVPKSFAKSLLHSIEILRRWVERLGRGCQGIESSRTNHGAGVPTFDILECGDLHRFTIWTDKGPVIAHNCQYMLGAVGLSRYAENYGVDLSEEEAAVHVQTYRSIYPEIPEFWNWVKHVVFHVVKHRSCEKKYGLAIFRDEDFLYITLPSGRRLTYYKPAVTMGTAPWDASKQIEKFTFRGTNPYTTKWGDINAHAGGIFENIIQAIARDVLAVWIRRVHDRGGDIRMHVHDEIVLVVDEAKAETALQALNSIAAEPIPWAPGLELTADGYVSKRYRKD